MHRITHRVTLEPNLRVDEPFNGNITHCVMLSKDDFFYSSSSLGKHTVLPKGGHPNAL
jgi:hypothetical protein